MKKNYFYSFFAALMLFVAMPATAQNFAISDLFGKWKFTAKIAWADDATEEQKAQLSGDCDVTIKESASVMAEIWGFAGSKVQQNINMIGAKEGQDMLRINDPNSSVYPAYLWDNLFIANLNGDNPYGYFNDETLEWEVEQLGYFYYNVDAVNGLITVPDFTIVQIDDKRTCKQGKLVATFTEVKMTLVEADAPKAVDDVSGSYKFKAGTSTYSTMSGSKIPTEFAVDLVSKSDDNKAYDATITIEGYDVVTIPATFDGDFLALNFDSTYIYTDEANKENSIRFADMNGSTKKQGAVQFKKNDNGFSLAAGGFSFVTDYVKENEDGEMEASTEMAQWYMDGSLKFPEETLDFNWAGVYTVNSKSVTLIDKENKDEWASEFEMKIEMVNTADGEAPAITSFLGYDIKSLCGGWVITPATDNKSAKLPLSGGYWTMAPLKSLGGGEYMAMTNAKGEADGVELTLTVNEDGTLAIENFAVAKHAYGAEEFNSIVVYKDVTAEPYVAPAFDWAGTYVFAGEAEKVSADDTTDYPEAFNVVVKFYEETAYTPAMYGVTEFMNTNVYNINYGPIVLNIAEDNNSATLANGNVYSLGGGNFMKIFDAEGSANPVAITLGENGAISMADFTIVAGAWGDNDNNTKVASYKNVTLKKVLGAPVLKSPDTSKDINSLQIFSFNFGEEVKVDVNYADGLSLMKGEEKVADFDLSWTEVYENGDVIFWLPFDAVVKEPGTYTLELPADMITAADGKEFIGAKYEFTVVAPAPSYSINPDGGKVNSIEKITIKCENVSEVVVDETKKARLVYGLVSYEGLVAKVENNIEITFDKIEDEGEYTLTIEEGLFTMKGLDGSEVANEEVEVTFTVEAAAAVTPLEIVSVTPAEGEVGEITEIAIVYNQDVYFGTADWMYYAVYLTAENGDKIAMWANYGTTPNTVVFVPVELNEEGYPVYDEYGNFNTVAIPAGKYTLNAADITVQYGAVIVSDGTYTWNEYTAFGSCEGTYTWTVTGVDTAIEGVEAEAENTVIYDLTGRRVNEITKAGIYIVNGKKVLVK